MELTGSNIKTKKLNHDLMIRLIMLLSVFILLLVFSYLLSSKYISAKEYDSLVINVAGLQRMRVREYTSDIYQTLVSIATADLKQALINKNKADLTARIFEQTMSSFLNGGTLSVDVERTKPKPGSDREHGFKLLYDNIVIPSIREESIRHHIDLTIKEWEELKRLSLLSLRSNTKQIAINPHVQQLQEQSTKAVLYMDYVVQLMQQSSEVKLKQLDRFLLSMVAVGIVVFFIITYFVYFNIVKPLGHSIDQIKSTSEKLVSEKKRAEDASAVKSHFLSSMSHELRTPMNAILGFAQMLDIDHVNLTELQHDNVTEILSAGKHLMALINEVLDLAKIESGKIDIDFERVYLDKVITESISLIKPYAELKNINIVETICGNGYYVAADAKRLKQVVVNLLSNAEKYNRKDGDILIDCEKINSMYLRINISDTGDGISKDNVDKLFTPFERLDKKDDIEGTGIGLVVTKNLVELMHGSIGVESIPGKGTTFWVQFAMDKRLAK